MKLRSVVLIVLALALASPAAAQTDFKALMRKTLDAWETMDPANAAPFYAKDPGNAYYDIAPLKYAGWDAYAAGVKKLVTDFVSIKFAINPDAQVHQSGRVAWTTATLRTDIVMKNGVKSSEDGRWTVVWEKRGKDWLIVHEHFSFPMPSPPSGPQSLYKRVGGYDAIAAVVDDFLGRLAGDAQLKRFFVGTSADSLKRIRQLVVEQLCSAAGGPCLYIGRTMRATHDGLNITEADWNSAVKHLVATLDKFNVPEKEKGELIGAVASLKPDIVIAPKR
jgi:hemoglobin